MHPQYTPKDVSRFWSKVNRTDNPNDCWEWNASRVSGGYGQAIRFGKSSVAHRVAWELTQGPIPEGIFVCHRCDNRLCCNPAHLFLGTARDNNRDKMDKGRARGGSRWDSDGTQKPAPLSGNKPGTAPNTSLVLNTIELEFIASNFNGSKSAAIHAALGELMKTTAGATDNQWVARVGELRQFVSDVNDAPQSAGDVEFYIEQLAADEELDDNDRAFLRSEFVRQYGIE